MKYFLLFLIIYSCSCKSKDKSLNKTTNDTLVHNISFHGTYPTDSLSKYSYSIFALYGNVQEVGTAFFYKKGSTIYLVSNYHAVKGWNPIKERIEFKTDSLWLKYKSKFTKKDTMVCIDISDKKIGKLDSFSVWDKPDLIKVPIKIPSNFVVNLINDLTNPKYFNKQPENIICYGYPHTFNTLFEATQDKYTGNYYSYGYKELDSIIKIKSPDLPKTELQRFSNTQKMYDILMPRGEHGYSGSPLIGVFREGSKLVYKFVGVMFGTTPITDRAWVINGNTVYNYLEQ